MYFPYFSLHKRAFGVEGECSGDNGIVILVEPNCVARDAKRGNILFLAQMEPWRSVESKHSHHKSKLHEVWKALTQCTVKMVAI